MRWFRPSCSLLLLTVAMTGSSAFALAFECNDYQAKVEISNGLHMEYALSPPTFTYTRSKNNDTSPTTTSSTLKVRLAYTQQSSPMYIGLGIPSDQGCTTACMIGSTAIVGVPSVGTVKVYELSGYEAGEYSTIASAGRMELTNATAVFEEGMTLITFALDVSSDDAAGSSTDGSLQVPGRNRFIWAVGEDTGPFLNDHISRGTFWLDLSPCTAYDSGGDALIDVGVDPQQTKWISHSVSGALAWAVGAPLAIASSWLRDLLPPGLWYKAHLYLNLLSSILTIAAFGLAVAIYDQMGRDHFKGPHQTMGLVMLLLICIQILLGLVRPAPGTTSSKSTGTESMQHGVTASTQHTDVQPFDNELEGCESPQTCQNQKKQRQQQQQQQQPNADRILRGTLVPSNHIIKRRLSTLFLDRTKDKSLTRVLWEIGHKVCGLSLLACGLWQCYSGLMLYQNMYAESGAGKAGIAVFWGWILSLAFVVAGAAAYAKVYSTKK